MREEVFLQLLNQVKLSDDEVSSRLEKALDPNYWRKLSPELSIEGAWEPDVLEQESLLESELDRVTLSFAEEGYFQARSIFREALVFEMSKCVENLRAEGWPPVFAFAYDQFWSLPRSPSLVKLLSRALGRGYRQIAPVYVHYVAAQKGAAGWGPHRDAPQYKNRVTVWISLSDATLDNGCMYLVPKNPMRRDLQKTFTEGLPLDWGDWEQLLQEVRASPVRAGSPMGWHSDVLHWGSLYKAGSPRIAVSQEFIGADEQCRKSESPHFDGCGPPPSFGQRLHIIAKAIKYYSQFLVLLRRYRGLGDRLRQVTAI